MNDTASQSGFYDNRGSNWITQLSLKTRTKVYELFYAQFGQAQKILDIGVTSETQSVEANFFEKLYPHKERITAAGIEDAVFLEQSFPGLKFIKIAPGQPLPFKDREFDVVFCHAVIEHIIGEKNRIEFLAELLRVGKNIFITTPNPFFPVEPHTKVPLLHVICPKLFYSLLDRGWISRFYRSSNLQLLSARTLKNLLESAGAKNITLKKVKTLGFPSITVASA